MTNTEINIKDKDKEVKPKRYKLIYADPPWSYRQTGQYGAQRHYKLMSLEDIKGMGDAIRALAAPDSVLMLWVTNSGLRQGLETMEAWGYEYQSDAIWDKGHRVGLGGIWRTQHETLLTGTRGRVKVNFRSQPSILRFPQTTHSTKPMEAIHTLERMFDGPYLELFARRRPNSLSDWDWWGAEVDSSISLAKWGYPVPSDAKFKARKTGARDDES